MTLEFNGTATTVDGKADSSAQLNSNIGTDQSTGSLLEARGLCTDLAARHGVIEQNGKIRIEYRNRAGEVYTRVRGANARDCWTEPPRIEQSEFWNGRCLKDEPAGPQTPLIITEGELDAVAVLQCGYQHVVSLPSGAANTLDGCRSKARKVLCYGPDNKLVLNKEIAWHQKVIVLTDGDIPGNFMRDAIVVTCPRL